MNIYLTLCSIRGPEIDNSNYWNYRDRLGHDSDYRSDLLVVIGLDYVHRLFNVS